MSQDLCPIIMITQDIVKFLPLHDDEDASIIIMLKEVGLSGDMDNSHVLSTIEQEMCINNWAKELKKVNHQATLLGLMTWMTAEMKFRMRATAPLRTGSSQVEHNIHHVAAANKHETRNRSHKCWICRTQVHWTDKYQEFLSLNHDCLKIVQENHAYFSCLKKAGRDHKLSTCSQRKQQCTETENSMQCRQYHHPLLHKENTNVRSS